MNFAERTQQQADYSRVLEGILYHSLLTQPQPVSHSRGTLELRVIW